MPFYKKKRKLVKQKPVSLEEYMVGRWLSTRQNLRA